MMLEIDVENLTKEEWLIFWPHLYKALRRFEIATTEIQKTITPEWFESNFRAGYSLVRKDN